MHLLNIIRGAVAVVGILLTADPATVLRGNASDWIAMIERLGLAVALVIFFVYTGWLREKRMAARLDKLENANNELERENTRFAERLSAVSEQVTAALQKDATIISEAMATLAERTCFAFKNREEFDAFKDALREWRASKKTQRQN